MTHIKYLMIVLSLALVGCATAEPKVWTCIADIDKNRACKVIPCDKISEVCKTGNYRIMKIFPLKVAYVYSVNPPTDMDKCRKAK